MRAAERALSSARPQLSWAGSTAPTLLGYATLPARARSRASCGPGAEVRNLRALAGARRWPSKARSGRAFARDRPLVVVGCAAAAGVSMLSLLDRAVGVVLHGPGLQNLQESFADHRRRLGDGRILRVEAYEGYTRGRQR